MPVISSVEFQRNFGLYQDKALAEPVTISKNGRERLVLLSVDEYQRLKAHRDGTSSGPENAAPPALQSTAHFSLKNQILTEPLRELLSHFHSIKSAFVYGSVAKGTDTERSDIDLMVVGDNLNLSELYSAAQNAEMRLGRKVSPTFLSPEEWQRKASQKGSFVRKVSTLPKIFLIGSEKDLQAWASKN
ncbi:type II toxin-antitoxin system prevent-host-death family antitoxin [Mesorhizobium sp.]|uniref:type II toxin-antitoxin system prevent-host-death family antitoxin n=1 Tax=Mesorhizobium sp. TaxID=1871066 RepID=UPI00257CDE79|nr:type II toxin-antitoxin system prevent-host-death family antitoxin [Mesorhizobium sp.]